MNSLLPSLAILLDFDGVIVSTLAPLELLFNQFCKDHPPKVGAFDFKEFNGWRIKDVLVYLYQENPDSVTLTALTKEYDFRLETIYDSCAAAEGLLEFLDQCKGLEIPVAITSSAPKKIISTVLSNLNISAHFSFIFSGNDVVKSKPDPECYRLSKSKLIAKEYWVVDDNPECLASAEAVGCRPFLFEPSEIPQKNYDSINFELLKYKLIDHFLKSSTDKFLNFQLDYLDKWSEEDPQANIYWQSLIEKNPNLYNGTVCLVDRLSVAGTCLVFSVRPSNYKKMLFLKSKKLGVSLGVSGLVIHTPSGDVLVGKRSSSVLYYKNRLELVPSGSLDFDKSPEDQLKLELSEEIGASVEVNSIKFLCMLYDFRLRVVDFCFLLTTESRFSLESTTSEYSSIQFMNLKACGMALEVGGIETSKKLLTVYESHTDSVVA